MKKLFYGIAATLLGATFLLLPTYAFAEENLVSYTPFSVQVGGTGAVTVEKAKENLGVPEVLQTAGQSETAVMSQKAVTDAIASGSGGGIVVTQSTGQSTTDVMSQKAVTDAIDSAQTTIVQITGQSETLVMSQKAVTNAIDNAAQNTIVQSTGQSETLVMSQKAVTDAINTVPQISIVNNTGNSTTDVMSQKAVTESILSAQTIFNMIWPVDSIYMSVSSVNPSNLFGGTWVRWGNGRTIVGVDENDPQGYFPTPEHTGGDRTHRHDFRIGGHFWYGATVGEDSAGGTGAYRYSDNKYDGWNRTLTSISTKINNGFQKSISTETPGGKWSLGDTDTANNWPPYITCYLWKRVA